MTADGNSRFRERDGSLGLLVRVDNENEVDGLVSGSFDWSGTEDADQTDLRASMTVSNKQREQVHMAMTADGNSRFRERDGSLGLLVRVDNENEVDGLVSGGLDWSGTEEANQTDLQASMTVINRNREKLHMAMTAD